MRSAMTWILIAAVAAATFYLQRNANENEARTAAQHTPPPLVVVEPGADGRAQRVDTPQAPAAGKAATSDRSTADPTTAAALGVAERERLEHALRQGDEVHVAIELLALAREGDNAALASAAGHALERIRGKALERAEAARGKDAAAERAALTVAYLAEREPARRQPMHARLVELTNHEIYSRRRSVECEEYTVAPGDSLSRIANRFRFPVDGIMHVNRLRRSLIRVGQRLKIPRGPFEVVVIKGEYRLIALQDGKWLAEFPIGTGRDDSTPEASFEIVEKTKNPTWYAPDGVYPYGHPKNILGTRWLGFNDTAEHAGFGIHGTARPESIGRSESSGCVRMHNDDVEVLYGLIPTGSRVRILP